jgi:hypothetical protein
MDCSAESLHNKHPRTRFVSGHTSSLDVMAERFSLELCIMSKILRLQPTQSAHIKDFCASNPPPIVDGLPPQTQLRSLGIGGGTLPARPLPLLRRRRSPLQSGRPWAEDARWASAQLRLLSRTFLGAGAIGSRGDGDGRLGDVLLVGELWKDFFGAGGTGG